MRYFSTFSGIGGFELGIQLAYVDSIKRGSERRFQENQEREKGQGLFTEKREDIGIAEGQPRGDYWNIAYKGQPTCVGYSEIDKYASQIYQKHFPNHKNYGDITKINAEELPDFDLLVGGFPCQSFSIAGKRRGFEDTRGTMFFELARILRAKQPRLFVFENVKGLLSHDNGNTFRTIIATLDELRYDLQWQIINSKNHGVPQNRERVFIVGHLRGTSRPQVFPFGTNDSKTSNVQGHNSNTLTARYYGAEATGTYIEEGKLDAQIRQLNNPTHSNDRVYGADGISPTLNTMQGGRRQPFIMDKNIDGNNYKREIVPTLRTAASNYNMSVHGAGAIRRLTPTECERLQGFPESEKCAILEVCKQVNANGVEIVLNTRVTDQDSVVQADVLIDCVENGVEIHSHGKLLLNAKNAEKKNWCHPLIKIDDFVQLLVGINTIKEKVIGRGKAESHQNEQFLTHHKSGLTLEKLSGSEIMLPVGDVENDLTTLNELLKFITLNHLDTDNSEQKLQILSLFVTRAISGYIPSEILNQNTFTIGIKTRVGHTYGISDTQRYKTLGNAVTVNVIHTLMSKLLSS